MTLNSLRAWAKREKAKAKGGVGEWIPEWHRKAISAYTWYATKKGPQRG